MAEKTEGRHPGPRRVHFVQSSHWDREWFMTFQDYRYRLVHLIDTLLDKIAAGEMAGPFTTDGQSILLEDYLEVRPHRRAEVEAALRTGALHAGPWYVLPDEFLVSGESLIRNIRMGREVVRSLGGEPSNAGFVGDLFGHNSQMPQLFSGFGIPCAYVWRGTNLVGKRHFIWEGADGTRIPAYRFGHFGYGDFSHAVRHADDPYHRFSPEQAAGDLHRYLDTEGRETEPGPILLFDGWDHQESEFEYHDIVEQCIDGDRFEVVFGTLDGYQAELLREADRIGPVIRGELREPGKYPEEQDTQWLIPGVLSSRIPLKQANHRCESALCFWAEPFSAFASTASGAAPAEDFLRVAWRYLLKNQPHDSICGCSIDDVHRDMEYRFAQSSRLAERVTRESLAVLAASIAGDISETGLRLVVFHPLPRERSGIVQLEIELPEDWPAFHEFYRFEAKPSFRIYDEHGAEIPYQRIAQTPSRQRFRTRPSRLAEGYRALGVRLAVELTIPACGYRTLRVEPEKSGTPTRFFMSMGGLARDRNVLENEFLRVLVADNGTVDLTDRVNGRVYSGLLLLEDCGDIGDGWYHGLALNDETFHSTACHADVTLLHDGPFTATIRVSTHLRVPESFDFRAMRRAKETVLLPVDNYLTLCKDTPYLEVRTVVRNTAADHRLRMIFPTGVRSGTYWTDSVLDVQERDVQLRPDNHLYRELEVETKPQRSWTAITDGDGGLAVVASGLPETAVRDYESRPIALTLLRSTRRTVYTDGEPDGLLLGRDLEYRCRIVPLQGRRNPALLTYYGQELAAGHRETVLAWHDLPVNHPGGTLPATAGFLRVDGPVVVTSTRIVAGWMEVRMFNPRRTEVLVRINFGALPPSMERPRRLRFVDLESRPTGEEVEARDGVLEFHVAPKQIRTIAYRGGV